MRVIYQLFAVLVLLTFTQCYIWSRKKRDKNAVPLTAKIQAKINPVSPIAVAEQMDEGTIPSINPDSTIIEVFQNGDWSAGSAVLLTPEECARNVDLGEIVCPKLGWESTCSLFSAVGTRVISCTDLRIDNSVFIVPQGRYFMLPTKGVGYVALVDHLVGTSEPIRIETLSVQPRVFELHNFITPAEADDLVHNAKVYMTTFDGLNSSSSSSTEDPYRQADLAYDISSAAAMGVKRRLFDLLGIFPFQEAMTDGMQTLRYHESGAYIAHMDWVEPLSESHSGSDSSSSAEGDLEKKGEKSSAGEGVQAAAVQQRQRAVQEIDGLGNPGEGSEHDFNSARAGTNRYATLVLYLSDVAEGGETVFPEVSLAALAQQPQYPPAYDISRQGGSSTESEEVLARQSEEEVALIEEVLAAGREVDEAALQALLQARTRQRAANSYLQQHSASQQVQQGSWQHDLLGYCRTHLTVRPAKTKALLFYSQYPDGRPDYTSRHGGCPVLQGEKWVSNVWVWNGERKGFWRRDSVPTVSASFESVDVEGVQLYWEDQLWETLVPGRAVKVNTFVGHTWHVKVEDQPLLTWTIEEGRPSQRFLVTLQAVTALLNAKSLSHLHALSQQKQQAEGAAQ